MTAADHLTVPRQHGLFMHHGIDLGDGTVAHYLEGKEILRSSLEEFCCGETVTVVEHQNSSTAGVTLRRAMGRIGEQKYNLLFNNCEHFANWCKTGLHRSLQMEEWLQTSSMGALALGQLMPAALLGGLRLLLREGLTDESAKQKALKGLKQLTKLRLLLQNKLEEVLSEIETWTEANSSKTSFNENKTASTNLLNTGHRIADELNAVEDLEERINSLINHRSPKAKYSQYPDSSE